MAVDVKAQEPTGRVIDVAALLDRQRIGPVHLLVLGLTALAMIVDGYDVFVVGYVLPAIAKDLGVGPAALTPVMLGQQIGLAAGAFFVSPLADKFGRRTVLIACIFMFGVLTLGMAMTRSIEMMALLRFGGGLFMSGVISNAIALTTEIAPHRNRATLVTIMFCGYTFGTAAGGYLATRLLGTFGWQGAFWAGGLLPLVLLPIWALALPESLHFRMQRNPRDPRIGQLLGRIDRSFRSDGTERFFLAEEKAEGVPVLALLRDGRAVATLLLWFSFFMSMLAINLVSAWTPTFYTTYSSMTLQHAAAIGLVMAIAGIVSMLFYGAVLDRFGASRVLSISFFVGAVAVASIGYLDWNSWLFYGVVVVEGAAVIGGQSGLNALASILYPTRMRATGIGWAFGAGRIGAMFGPGVGGFMLTQHWAVGPVFLTAALPVLLIAVATFLVNFGEAQAEGGTATSRSPAT